jgi:hypothetical protein
MGGCRAGADPRGACGVSAGMFFRASVRRAAVLPPLWLGRRGGALRQVQALRQAQGERDSEIQFPVVGIKTADARSGREGSAAAVTSGSTTGPLGACEPANADQSWTRSQAKARGEARGGRPKAACVGRASRPGRGRSRPATSETMDVTAGETAPELPSPAEPDPGAAGAPEPAAPCLPSTGRPVRAPQPDWARVAAAARARPLGPAPKRPPTRHALDRGPCPRCGIPGARGCDHQLPFDEAAL